MIDRRQRYRGCLMGLAVGDALGTTLEFRPPGTFEPITDMVGGGPFNLEPGQWTDDTSMALCLAHSLLARRGFDADDQMRRYCDWRTSGYMSSNGRCFDIGMTVSTALNHYQHTGDPFAGSTDPFAAGNGSLMRLAPVAMYFSPDSERAIHFAGESSRTTHGAAECVDACRYLAALLDGLFEGRYAPNRLTTEGFDAQTPKIRALQRGEYLKKTIQEIRGSGYVIDCLEAALWCFTNTCNFRDAVLCAANLGDDADTTAAVCGQIAGAYYGLEGIPAPWQQRVTMGDSILRLADSLLEASGNSRRLADERI